MLIAGLLRDVSADRGEVERPAPGRPAVGQAPPRPSPAGRCSRQEREPPRRSTAVRRACLRSATHQLDPRAVLREQVVAGRSVHRGREVEDDGRWSGSSSSRGTAPDAR